MKVLTSDQMIANLKDRLENDESLTLTERADILDEIEELNQKKGKIRPKPNNQDIDCFGCGS